VGGGEGNPLPHEDVVEREIISVGF
jgi:hypothetical protein